MRSRSSKSAPGPLIYTEKPATMTPANTWLLPSDMQDSAFSSAAEFTASPAPPKEAADYAKTQMSGVQQSLHHNSVALPTLLPTATVTGDVAETLSSDPNVCRAGVSGVTAPIDPRTTVLVADHVTNTGAVVRLERVDYSKAMRAYRVCRQDGGIIGDELVPSWQAASPSSSKLLSPPSAASSPRSHRTCVATPADTSRSASSSGSVKCTEGASALGHNPAPWRLVFLRLFSAADMMLLAVAVACFLVVVSRLRVEECRPVDKADATLPASLSWLAAKLTRIAFARAMVNRVAGLSGARPHFAEGVPQRTTPGSPATSSSAAAFAATGGEGEGEASVAYGPATHSTTLDMSVTFGLLLLSTLLLAKRLGGALRRVYVEEVLVVRGVGLQFSAYGIFNTVRYRHFVDLLMLRSLVIHDAFFRYQPIFFLSSSVENKSARVVFFPDTLPRLEILRAVLNGIRGVLYGEPEEGMSLAELEDRRRSTWGDLSDVDLTDDSFAEDTATTPNDPCLSEETDCDED